MSQKEEFKVSVVTFHTRGAGRINLPRKWVEDMGFDENEKKALVIYDYENKELRIKKVKGME